ncbi:hypothetical protein IMZ48_41175 [Candidatus Bathyarchaeota archaeon]|nr:hypothetical protein [Candidatus Bathyarchaeota archaeon]
MEDGDESACRSIARFDALFVRSGPRGAARRGERGACRDHRRSQCLRRQLLPMCKPH